MTTKAKFRACLALTVLLVIAYVAARIVQPSPTPFDNKVDALAAVSFIVWGVWRHGKSKRMRLNDNV
jgi:hypothetical protein